MKKSELFRQAYCAEKTQSWFCLDEDGNVLWANSAAEEELPLLEVGKPVSDGPFTFPKGEENESFLILAGGRMAGVVLGAAVPITINSRGAAPEEKYSSILICSAMA